MALLKLSRAWAAIEGRDYVVPDDIKRFAQPALAHRLTLDSSLWDIRQSENVIVGEITGSVPVPVFRGGHDR
jgi:MoxR-like ATPase